MPVTPQPNQWCVAILLIIADLNNEKWYECCFICTSLMFEELIYLLMNYIFCLLFYGVFVFSSQSLRVLHISEILTHYL